MSKTIYDVEYEGDNIVFKKKQEVVDELGDMLSSNIVITGNFEIKKELWDAIVKQIKKELEVSQRPK